MRFLARSPFHVFPHQVRLGQSPPFIVVLVVLAGVLSWASAGSMLEIADLLSHPEQYDHQDVTVFGRVSNLQVAANQKGQIAYGFLLKDGSASVKVIGMGKTEVHEGDQVIVEGIFSRLRQTGRAIVYNEIKASFIRPLEKLTPDLVG
jgi:hypothetical protein